MRASWPWLRHRLATLLTLSIIASGCAWTTGQTLPNGVVGTHAYDDASRLTSLVYTKGAATVGDLLYTYDRAGQRVTAGGSLTNVSLPTAVATTTYNANNQLRKWHSNAIQPTYDLNGNMLSDGTYSYIWNARDELVTVKQGTPVVASYAYDGLGRRTSKTIQGTATGFVYGAGNFIQETTGGSPSANLLTGGVDQTFVRTDAGGARYPLTDALGSIIGLTDALGTIQTTYTYEPYGRATRTGAASTNSQQYTGREHDGLALTYYRARYYNPTFGRFISEDPIGFRSSDYNLYRYVAGSPTNATDPSGRVLDTAIDIGFIGYDLYALVTGSRKDTGANLLALGLDVLGLAVPFVTGLGALSRTGRLADEVLTHGDEALAYVDDVAAAVCSFPADTPVATPDGSKEIGELEAGDTVLAWDETTGRLVERPISAVSAHPEPALTRLVIDGEPITTTPDHPFYTEETGWTEAGELRVGQHVLSASGASGVVGSVETFSAPARLHDLTVAGAHTYFVGQGRWLVHNCPRPATINVPGGSSTVSNVLDDAHKWLGPDYKEIAPGVFRSADGTRQFRMTTEGLTSGQPHVHFESIGPDGRWIVETSHVNLLDR